ncbi:unnamed protein product [Protopolystoma xenopodis]|uniref:Uncharacterized protein n=1 Tax=Protopolystoma xenopodis TaxID=117903 RepID=A0A448XM80_9PLAT|nr:unnamed protein product [Protopolystoma xenopodis]
MFQSKNWPNGFVRRSGIGTTQNFSLGFKSPTVPSALFTRLANRNLASSKSQQRQVPLTSGITKANFDGLPESPIRTKQQSETISWLSRLKSENWLPFRTHSSLRRCKRRSSMNVLFYLSNSGPSGSFSGTSAGPIAPNTAHGIGADGVFGRHQNSLRRLVRAATQIRLNDGLEKRDSELDASTVDQDAFSISDGLTMSMYFSLPLSPYSPFELAGGR